MAEARVRHNFLFTATLTSAFAWNSVANAEVSSSPKGIVGGALLGAELTVIGEAIAGIDVEWMYLAGAGVGAVGGGIGGYFVDETESPGWSIAMLVGGMALAIPAFVLSLDATRRHWSEPIERRLPNEPTSNPPDPDAGPELTLLPLPKGGKNLLRWNQRTGPHDTLSWSLPDVYVTEAFSPADRARYSLPAATLIQVPVFAANW
jgi:hypothetical protein